MNTVELLDTRGCHYSDYDGILREAAIRWSSNTSRSDIYGRKDWEFIVMASFLMKFAKEPESMRVLDSACGREPLVEYLARQVKSVVATDLWEPNYLAAAGIEIEDFLWNWRQFPNVSPAIMDSMRLQFSDNVFDFTFCVSSIEHMGPEDGQHVGAIQALRELIRVTKPGGIIAFSTEFNPECEKGSWYFSSKELTLFIEKFTGSRMEFPNIPMDGKDEKFGVYPAAFAMRKL